MLNSSNVSQDFHAEICMYSVVENSVRYCFYQTLKKNQNNFVITNQSFIQSEKKKYYFTSFKHILGEYKHDETKELNISMLILLTHPLQTRIKVL